MLLPRRIKLLLATALAASSLTVVIAAYSSNDAKTESETNGPTLKSKILRRKDRLTEKPNEYEKALLRKHAIVQEERELEDNIPAHLPIKVKIRGEKEKGFKDLENDRWAREFEIEVKNTGTKPIYYLLLLANLPEVPMESRDIGFVLRYGSRPELSEFQNKVEPQDIPIKPGETVVLKFGSGNALGWESFQRTTQTPQPKKIMLRFQKINFGDGTGFLDSGGTPWPRPRKTTALGGCEGSRLPNIADLDSNKRRLGGELARFAS